MAGSLAHARGLAAAGLLDPAQLEAIESGLREVVARLDDGDEIVLVDEDVHSLVERLLTEITPEGARLHAGRSRNDQVALDLRLFSRTVAAELAAGTSQLIEALAEQAASHADWVMPGYTHLQRAQPVTLGHHLLAHAEAHLRDGERLRHAYNAADRMPLGSGALAGSTLALRPDVVARELGFSELTRNSMDAVADRDFALDLVYACTTIGLHLSRLAEDVVIWASSEFGFLKLADEVATGSSLMPQKKNPDIAELLRGRSGRALGALVALATVLKGLPLTYNRDLQEDKEALFGATENAAACLDAARVLVERLVFDQAALAAAAADPGLLATDSAERLVEKGKPFRQAHREVGEQVLRGRHQPPWDSRRSLERRGLAVEARAGQVMALAVELSEWSDSHPPPLPR